MIRIFAIPRTFSLFVMFCSLLGRSGTGGNSGSSEGTFVEPNHNTPRIISFTPAARDNEIQVMFGGKGFATVRHNNLVSANGFSAQISDTTKSEVGFRIPPGASTDFAVVGAASGSVQSAHPFLITRPTISTVVPTAGIAHSVVLIKGQNFSSTQSSNQVFFGTVSAMVISSTNTEILTEVPAQAETGHITVRTADGISISPDPFTVLEPKPRFAYVYNEGNGGDERIYCFGIDSVTGQAKYNGYFRDGTQPRDFTISPDSRYLFLIKFGISPNVPLGIGSFKIDQLSGKLVEIPGSPFAVANFFPTSIAVHPAGLFLYVTGQDLFGYYKCAVFAVNQMSGALAFQGISNHTPIGFHPNGNIAYESLSPSGLRQLSIDPTTGLFSDAEVFINGSGGVNSCLIDPTGRFLFVLRNYSVSVFKILQGGASYSFVGDYPAGQNSGGALVGLLHPTGRKLFCSGDLQRGFHIDPTSGTLTPFSYNPAAIVFPGQLAAVDPSGQFGFYLSPWELQTCQLDATTGEVSPGLKVKVGRYSKKIVITSGNTPFAYTPKSCYVANSLSNNVSAYQIDPASGMLSSQGDFSTGSYPRALAPDPVGSRLFVLNNLSQNGTLFNIDPNSGSLAFSGALISNCAPPVSMGIDLNGDRAFLIGTNEANINRLGCYSIDASSDTWTQEGFCSVTDTNPQAIVVHQTGKFVYTANYASNNISGFQINNYPAVGLTPLQYSPFAAGGVNPKAIAVRVDGTYLYSANEGSNNISIFKIATGQTTDPDGFLIPSGTIPVGQKPNGIAVSPDGQYLFITNHDSNDISLIKTFIPIPVHLPIGNVGLSGSPTAIAVDPSGSFVYVTLDTGNANVVAFRINREVDGLDFLGSFGAGSGPLAIATVGFVQ